MRPLYPADWRAISDRVRFDRAGGRCENCQRWHGELVAGWKAGRDTKIVLATAHLNHDPRDNSETNLASLCQRCHLAHDRPHHQAERALTLRRQLALGDLFRGPYSLAAYPWNALSADP